MGHLAKSISNYAAAEIKGKYSNPRQMYEHRSHVVLVSFLVYFDEGIWSVSTAMDCAALFNNCSFPLWLKNQQGGFTLQDLNAWCFTNRSSTEDNEANLVTHQ